MKQRPAAMPGALDRSQIGPELGFELRFEIVQEVVQKDVFGRDRRIGLELEQNVAVGLLLGEQRLGRLRRD
jgi:hypothetical protein